MYDYSRVRQPKYSSEAPDTRKPVNELELDFALAEYIFYLSLLILNDREFSISYGDIRGYSSLIIVISIVKCIKIEILEVIYYRIVDFIKAFNGILRKEAGDM